LPAPTAQRHPLVRSSGGSGRVEPSARRKALNSPRSGGGFLLRLIALSYHLRIILVYAISAMIEIVIERWTNAEGETAFNWSVWGGGHRIQMGENTHSSADDCEVEAVEFFGGKPDRVTRL